ncbi:5'-nucleotidase [Paracidovorax wautersii]|uniref:5'-nucleotidase n=1 Tax=Paracidovorax wautersii TaxID=1177982 RepID=A0ABU1IAW7_9BURK|nr:5'-nucleotidase [Paracidovorax wautersii]MDR6214366.1 5'-nucleotidase [Paracidovorax wautersii]
MAQSLSDKLVVAISSRALFDFEEENRLFETGDEEAYMRRQLEFVHQPARPGIAFPLVRKLLAFNTEQTQRVEVVMLSRNDPASGMRVFASAKAAGMRIERGVFTRGRDPFSYLRPLGAHLFLSANEADVRQALSIGFPAARVMTDSTPAGDRYPQEVRIAFDGDAVLFSDEAERIYQQGGLPAFQLHEVSKAATPLASGPFRPLLAALHQLQQQADASQTMRIRTALVTARSAPAHERAVRTLLDWGVTVDEAMFLGGLEKGPFLREFEPDFFFDDQTSHVTSAARHVPAGHVSSGISNLPA